MEIWKDAVGFENYQVSNFGRVKRIEHIAQHPRYGNRKLCERLLKGVKNKDGYIRIKIKSRFVFAHVLVLESFVCSKPPEMVSCHNNGVPDDNRLENLRWDTQKNNVQDRKKHGTYQWGNLNPNSIFRKNSKGKYIHRIEDIS